MASPRSPAHRATLPAARRLVAACVAAALGAAGALPPPPRRMLPAHVARRRPVGPPFAYGWEERNFSQFIDQFNFNGPASGATYQQRYLINDTFWAGPDAGPIFAYLGNEGFIELFAQNTGFLWEVAQEMDALVVFLEHRYYGTSLPFGADAYASTANQAYLSAEQALVDAVSLLASLKANLSAADAPVVAFGGSYGGMLAAWAQIRHPGAFAGAIAASAPILQFPGETDPRLYMETITNDFKAANPASAVWINASWGVMGSLAGSQAGRDALAHALRVCEPLTAPENVTGTVFNWLGSALGFLAMADYPYAASFLGPLPPWPVSVAASFFDASIAQPTPDDILLAIVRTANLFYNFSGQAGDCFQLLDLDPPGLTQPGWDYQCCTEVVQSLGQYGPPTDMFWPAPFDPDASIAWCQYAYNGTTPRLGAGRVQYGGARALASARNIVFSQGTLDPWSRLGPMANVSGNPSIVVALIEQGAHHLDLRAANPADPASVVAARNVERAAIRRWLAEWRGDGGRPGEL